MLRSIIDSVTSNDTGHLWPVFSAARREFDKVKSNIKQRVLKILALLAVLIGHAGLSLPVYPASSTSDINISANINGSCTMSNTDLNFGDYDAFGANATQDLLATATITTTCTPGTIGSVKMDNGKHPSSKVSRGRGPSSGGYNRNMASGSSKLKYEIYRNEGLTSVWNFLQYKTVIASGTSEDLPVYAKVFKNQLDAAAGSYTDIINITLTY